MTTPEPEPGELPARAGLSGGILTILFVGVVAVGALVATFTGGTPTAEVGKAAPHFAVVGFDGTTFDLTEHVDSGGGPILLNLWASWCEPCRREFPTLSAYAEEREDVTVIGVAVQDQEENARQFAEEIQPEFFVAWDADNFVRDTYPAFGLPATYVIDANGVVVDVVAAELTPERLEAISFSR